MADDAWKYRLGPASPTSYSASFDYDGKGRAVTVNKLQKFNSLSGNLYTRTQSSYGPDGAPAFGNATMVIEDSGGVNRVTQTLAFDVAGKAIDTQDAAGKRFHTTYDGDEIVQSVDRTDVNPNKNIVAYTYGTTDGTIENGQPTSVTDGISGVNQSISYVQTVMSQK